MAYTYDENKPSKGPGLVIAMMLLGLLIILGAYLLGRGLLTEPETGPQTYENSINFPLNSTI